MVLWRMLGDPNDWLWEPTNSGWHYRHRHTNLEFISYDGYVIFRGFDTVSQSNYFIYPWWMRQALSFRACRMRRRSHSKSLKLMIENDRKKEFARISNARLGIKQ